MPIGTSDGQVYETGVDHAQDIPMYKELGGYGGSYDPKTDVWTRDSSATQESPVQEPTEHAWSNLNLASPISKTEPEMAQEAREKAAQKTKQAVGPSPTQPQEIPEHLQTWSGYAQNAASKLKEAATETLKHPENLVQPGELTGIFGGTNFGRAMVGEFLEKMRVPANKIKEWVGIERGAEGHWRTEISDDAAVLGKLRSPRLVSNDYDPHLLKEGEKFHPDMGGHWEDVEVEKEPGQFVQIPLRWVPGGGGQWVSSSQRLGDVLQHSRLYEKYPEAADIKIRLEPQEHMDAGGHRAYFDSSNNTIAVSQGLTADERLRSVLHEIQHWVQDKEGFPMDHPSFFQPEWSMEVQQMLVDHWLAGNHPYMDVDELKALTANDMFALHKMAALEFYLHQASETEARNTSYRMHMTPVERARSLASSTEDVDRHLQFVSKKYIDDLLSKGGIIPKTNALFGQRKYTPKVEDPAAASMRSEPEKWYSYIGGRTSAGESIRDIAKDLRVPEHLVQTIKDLIDQKAARNPPKISDTPPDWFKEEMEQTLEKELGQKKRYPTRHAPLDLTERQKALKEINQKGLKKWYENQFEGAPIEGQIDSSNKYVKHYSAAERLGEKMKPANENAPEYNDLYQEELSKRLSENLLKVSPEFQKMLADQIGGLKDPVWEKALKDSEKFLKDSQARINRMDIKEVKPQYMKYDHALWNKLSKDADVRSYKEWKKISKDEKLWVEGFEGEPNGFRAASDYSEKTGKITILDGGRNGTHMFKNGVKIMKQDARDKPLYKKFLDWLKDEK